MDPSDTVRIEVLRPKNVPEGLLAQSNIVRHVPSRAKNINQILDFASKSNVTNEMLIKVGLRMNGNLLFGSNHRCVAMLIVFKSIMDDLNITSGHSPSLQRQSSFDMSKSSAFSSTRPLGELQQTLKRALDFLDFCRPLSVSMTNAFKVLNEEILKLNQADANKAIADIKLDQERSPSSPAAGIAGSGSNQHESESFEAQKQQLKSFIDRFIDEEIWSAQRGICENISGNITAKDVILVYGCSTIVQHVLLHAKTRGKNFRVIVVDSPPHFNGRRMLSFLNSNSIDVSYTLINSLSYVMRQPTKVLLGANSMLANGYVMSHIGTSQVALMARASNVPTLVCCETYKLSDRVYVDSFGCNEVDSGNEIASALNLRYDLTPPEFVSMVINEKSTVPAESVPALLRFRAEKTKTSLYTP